MGQNPTQVKTNEDYTLVQQLPTGNIVKHHKTQSLHFLKEYSFTAQDAYQNALNMHSLKLANKNQHILNFQHFTTKSENSFCSTFHKIVLIFQYIDYSLENQMTTRLKQQRNFTQKEMWSVLCSCVLAAVHLIHTEGRMHCGLTPKDIRLTPSGCIKLLSHQMIGLDASHSQSEGRPRALALTLMECLLLQRLTNQNKDYLENLIQNLDCSRDMKEILTMMISADIKFPELEEHLFKLVQDDQSLASHSNTPILQAQSPFNSNYKCPKIYRNQQNDNIKKDKGNKIQLTQPDCEDTTQDQLNHSHPNQDAESPDETDTDGEGNLTSRESPQKINSFYLRERKIQENVIMEKQEESKPYKIQDKKQMKQRQIKQQDEYKINKGQENIFTDPKLFSLIKSDLEDIKMRKSIADLAKTEKQQIFDKPNNAYRVQTKLLDQKVPEKSHSIEDLYIENKQEEIDRVNKDLTFQPHRLVQNIMNDPEIGFRKKQKQDGENRQLTLKTNQKHGKSSNPQYQNLFLHYAQSGKEEQKLVKVNENYTKGRYEGTKLNGKRHGFGTFFYVEGGKYVGNWFENKMHGKGTLYYPNQSVAYEGEWKNDQLSGYGVLFNEQVTYLRIPFDYRDFSDVQEYWVKYQGYFSEDNKEGKGKLYLTNGQRLEATFQQDKVDGEGFLFRGDGTSVRGKWRQNKLVALF